MSEDVFEAPAGDDAGDADLASSTRRATQSFWWVLFFWTALMGGLAGLGLASALLRNRPWELPLGLLWVAVWFASVSWYLVVTPRPLQDCLLLEDADHGWMSRLVEGLEDELGVPLPDFYAVMPRPGLAVHMDRRGKVTLAIGGPLLCYYEPERLRDELTLGVLTASMLRLPAVGRVERRRMRLAALVESQPVILIDKTLARFFTRVAHMHESTWATASAALGRQADEVREAERTDLIQAWEHFTEQFLRPAHRLSARPGRVLDGFNRFLAAQADHDVLTLPSGPRHAAIAALPSADATDSAMTALAYRDVERSWSAFEWDEYPEKIIAPALRHRAARLLRAVDTVSGTAVPATVPAVWSRLMAGSWQTVGGVLGAHDEESAAALVQAHFAALATLAFIDDGGLGLRLDWLQGYVVSDTAGDVALVPETVADAWERQSIVPVLALLDRYGVVIDDPLLVAGTETGSGAPYAEAVVQPVFHRAQLHTLAEDGAHLLLLRPLALTWVPRPLRLLRFILSDLRLWQHTELPVSELQARDAVRGVMPLADVVAVKLKPSHWGWYAWTCRISTPTRSWTMHGAQPLGLVAANLEALFADRLSVRGLRPDITTGAWTSRALGPGRRVAARTLHVVAAIFAIAALTHALVASTGEQRTAEVASCSVDQPSQRYYCEVRVPSTGDSERVWMKPQEPGTSVSILISPDWANWDPEATRKLHEDTIAFAVFAAVLFGLALLTTRWRAPLIPFGGIPAVAPSIDD